MTLESLAPIVVCIVSILLSVILVCTAKVGNWVNVITFAALHMYALFSMVVGIHLLFEL